MKRTFAAGLVAFSFAGSGAAQENKVDIVNITDCQHLRWQFVFGSPHHEWVCPNGVRFVLKRHWTSQMTVEKAEAGDGRCRYHQPEQVWICPIGFNILPREHTIVAVPEK